eukprot:CAMPEP_0176380782 /NCGR_PEP_ID=MMETSP0126-20121128/31378_1 /TAXON_ID=141414 ORGANISM="Strombidinopsis acuminatum, Strain SPMC142" /NCGR_SAMPLE_ID=MMETSP0126 /ASSEMBLY_ACC=CAM_ASM_000229 /LENGTH=73 /DNA_ID=CAMNT_0017744255 /DNA_START=517 /DNA_END=735 /DNA_ORIENTATION=-
MDGNIKKGVPCNKATNQILKAMTLKRTEFIVGADLPKGIDMHLLPIVAVMSETIADRLMDWYYKKQLNTKQTA